MLSFEQCKSGIVQVLQILKDVEKHVFLANFGFDTAENEPAKNLEKKLILLIRRVSGA